VPVSTRSSVGLAILVIRYLLTKGGAMNGVVPYGVTCARRARVMSVDLEGHAPSRPLELGTRPRQSVALQITQKNIRAKRAQTTP